MRIIAGSAKGRRLAEFTGHVVRPTPDRVREALFSILQSRIGSFDGLRVLDLFAGSGALAIEALSRGADKAYLIEKAATSVKIINENLQLCHLNDRAIVLRCDVRQVWSQLTTAQPFALIFLDPPYGQGMAEQTITKIAEQNTLAPEGLLCVETSASEDLPEAVGSLNRVFQRRYGTVMINLYSHADEDHYE